MATKKDVAWLASQGGRIMPKDGEETKEATKPSMTEQIKRMHEDKLLLDTQREIFGSGGQTAQPQPAVVESLANTIVTQSMKDQQHLISQMNLETASLRRDMAALQKDGVDTQTRLFAEMYGRIQDKQDAMDKTAREAAAAGAPPDVFTSYFKVKEELDKIAPPQLQLQPQGISGEVQLQIADMKLKHEERLAELTAENARQDRQWQLTLLQFQEDSKRRWAEYIDGKAFRQEGMAGLTDLVTSISSGIKAERGVGGDETIAEAAISQFACQQCQTPITVPPGAVTAICPNSECGAQYEIKGP